MTSDFDGLEVILDISRLLSRIRHAAPTGVDRVEMAYARGLIHRIPDNLQFSAVHPTGFYGRIPSKEARNFLDRVEAFWEGDIAPRERLAVSHLTDLWRLRPRRVPRQAGRRVYVQSSPHHLDDEGLVRDILRREQARFVCLLHDLIPIEFPEYARPGGSEQHRRRIRTVARLADAAIVNSEATRRSFLPYIVEANRDFAVETAHLGLDLSRVAMPAPSERDRPYFICIGTIEPRKNHLLLLNIWRKLSQQHGPRHVPRLILIGRRGWENEQIVDMLDRCPWLRDCVEELNGVPDSRMRSLLMGARALLLPSFAEGFGMPVPEALAAGIPVLCSDLPALREAGGAAPEYLDPLDGPSWTKAVLDYAANPSVRREQQLARISRWVAPTWDSHISVVMAAITKLCDRRQPQQ